MAFVVIIAAAFFVPFHSDGEILTLLSPLMFVSLYLHTLELGKKI